MELEALRKEIDRIDDQLIALFSQRMEVAAKIADYKHAKGLPIYVPQREAEKLEDVEHKAGALAPYARTLYSTLFSLSRKYQEER